MNDIKISIITATYNSGKTLEQTISSVVNQTYDNIEYIIIDGGSTDNTIDIIKKYEDKIYYWISEADKGIYDAFNKGVLVATGDYIEFIGSDDCFVSENSIKQIVKNIDNNTDILSANEYVVMEDCCKQYLITNEKAINKSTFKGGMIPHAAMFTKKQLLIDYPFDISYRIAGDTKFFFTCYMNESIKFKYIDLPVVFFSHGGISANMVELSQKEDDRLYDELGWQYRTKDIQMTGKNKIKETIKSVLKFIGILEPLRLFRNRHFLWEKHHCNNKICRWCGRK